MDNFHYELRRDGVPTNICFTKDRFEEIEKLKDELNKQNPKAEGQADERHEIYIETKDQFHDVYFKTAESYLKGDDGYYVEKDREL